MEKLTQTHILYEYYLELLKNPRLSWREFHRKYSPYRALNSTNALIHRGFNDEIITKPFIYCNYGLYLSIFDNIDNPLKLLEEKEKNSKITYAMALCGDQSFISVSTEKIGDPINYAEIITPLYPSNKYGEWDALETEGKLNSDDTPDWDEMDWRVFHAMRNPMRSFFEAGKEIETSWMTIKRHFERILGDCKVMTGFFPNCFFSYDRIIMTFKTKFEIGLRNELLKFDRSSYFWKFKDKILLCLFLDKCNGICKKYKEMEEIGIINDLNVSIPIKYHSLLSWDSGTRSVSS